MNSLDAAFERARRVTQRSVIRLMNVAPAPVASRFGTATKLARFARPITNTLMPDERVLAIVRAGAAEGLRLRIDPRLEKFYWTGQYETPVQEAFRCVLRPGQVVWDVGAHLGFFASLAARLVEPSGRVHAFEPLPANRARLIETMQLNGPIG